MNLINKLIILFFLILTIACKNNDVQIDERTKDKQNDRNGEYFGLNSPGDSSQVFAPNFVSTSLYTRDIAFIPDGKEAYFCVSALGYNLIFETKQDTKGFWSEPKPASFIKDYSYMYFEPFITYDGKKMLFLSNMPDKDSIQGDQDIWCVDKKENGWGKPYNIGEPINTPGAEFFPSLTKTNTLYFTGQPEGDPNHYIFRSQFTDGKYQEPEILPKEVNIGTARFNAFISPDEDYIIIPAMGMEDSFGGTDYYIVFRNEKDEWSNPINMGEQINSDSGREYSASLSYDGKYLFFMSDKNSENEMINFTLSDLKEKNNDILNGNSNIYWISSNIIKKLKAKQ